LRIQRISDGGNCVVRFVVVGRDGDLLRRGAKMNSGGTKALGSIRTEIEVNNARRKTAGGSGVRRGDGEGKGGV